MESKVPDVTNLATKTALTIAENKIPSVSNLVKKTDYNTKVAEIKNKLNNHNHDKYITTSEFNKLAADVFNARLARVSLVTKTDFGSKLSNLNRNITKNKADHLLVQNGLKKLQTFDLSYFIGMNYFEEGGAQNYLVLQPRSRYFKTLPNTNYVLSWKSKGLSAETNKSHVTSLLTASDHNLIPTLSYSGTKKKLKFTGSYSKQDQISYTHRKVVNVYIVYETGASGSNDNDTTLKNCLFGTITLAKNTDIDKYGYSGYGIGFDRRSSFSFPGGGFGQSILIFGVDMSFSKHIDDKKKDILVLGKGPTQRLEHILTAEKMYSINVTETKKKCCLSLHYNGGNSYIFVNVTEIYKFRAKDSEDCGDSIMPRKYFNGLVTR